MGAAIVENLYGQLEATRRKNANDKTSRTRQAKADKTKIG